MKLQLHEGHRSSLKCFVKYLEDVKMGNPTPLGLGQCAEQEGRTQNNAQVSGGRTGPRLLSCL
jgi:hypothetical protein